jgi:hypothetical protein
MAFSSHNTSQYFGLVRFFAPERTGRGVTEKFSVVLGGRTAAELGYSHPDSLY